ncbi:hypothetical protein KKC91_07850 [bacterium]|nr:hypothetical protein [bacterium]
MNKVLNDLLKALDALWNNFNNCRAYFPCIQENAVGSISASTAPYYIAQGFNISFVFSKRLSKEGILKINQIGHWINQNFIVRLCALLESYHILSNSIDIDFTLDGANHINIVRRLRNYFAHSSGKFNPENKDHVITIKLIRDHVGISIDNRSEWPLSIDTVLKPLYEGCVNYSKQKMENRKQKGRNKDN